MQPSKTEAFWRRHVEARRSSGLTQKHYGVKHGVNALTLAHWSHRIKRKPNAPTQALVPIRVVGEVSAATIELRHIQVRPVIGSRRFAGHDETAVAHADTDASVRREPGAPQPVPTQANVKHLPIAAVFAAEQRRIVRGADGDAPLDG